MAAPLPYWHPEADYSKCPFFIRRMNTRGFVKAAEVPRASVPLVGFIYLATGEVLVEAEDRSFLCGAGHLLLVPENRPFAILHYSDAVGYTGGFQATLPENAKTLQFLGEPLQQAFWFDEAAFIGELFNMLTVSFEHGDRAFIEKGMDLLLSRIKATSEMQLPQAVSSVLDEVFSHDRAIVSANAYAEERGVSLNYLNRLVKKSTGRPLSTWIDIARVNRAKRLLKESRAPVIDIAAEVGLLDQAYFARFFRKHTGMTPTEFRKMMHG